MPATGKNFNLEAQHAPIQQIGGVNSELYSDRDTHKYSVRARCPNCFTEQFTRVDAKVSSKGKIWAILCCFFGSWILSLLVLCMGVFREYVHYCPACHSIVGIYRPPFSARYAVLLVLITLVTIALQIGVIILVVFLVPSSRY